MNINEITEIHEGIYHTVLDFPNQSFLISSLIDQSLQYVLLCKVELGNFSWQDFKISGSENLQFRARSITGDFLISTKDFIACNEKISWQWAIQLERIPPTYFDFGKIQGNQKYQILKDCGFRFIVQSQPRSGDLVVLISPFRKLLENATNFNNV